MARRSRSGAGPTVQSVGNVASTDHSLRQITQRAAKLQALKDALWPHLPKELRAHCDVANCRDSTLVLTADSAVWATRLRHSSPEILHIVRSELKIAIANVVVRIVPRSTAPDTDPSPRKLSPAASRSLARASEVCTDEQLKAAFLRLADEKESDD